MNKYPKIILAVLLAAALALGSIQGVRLRHLREAEMFYRWILAEATQFSIFSDIDAAKGKEDEGQKKMDRELFARIIEKTEPALAAEEQKEDASGKPLSKILSVATDDNKNDVVWQLAQGKLLAKERADFLQYLRDKKLSSVASQFDPGAVYSDTESSVSIGNIFFGFRKIAANFVWLQVDRYWHEGMMQRMIPLMKTCVMLDPTFVDAYLLGAWHLAFNATAKMMDTPEPLRKWNDKYKARVGEKETYYYLAVDFLEDGVRKNPRNYRLYFDLGYGIYNIKLKDYANAVKYLSLAIQQRHDRWVPRMLYLCYELNGQYQEALDGWQDYKAKNAGNVIEVEKAERFIERNTGLLKEKQADAAVERAKAAPTPAQADAGRAEANTLREEARQIWESLSGPGKDEPFAMGRLMRMKAVKLIEEQRYLEAIAILENARWKSNEFFEEASRMIIDTKIKAGVPLSTSEKKAVIRREEEQKYKQQQGQNPA
jgi:hypothetical protein